MLITSSSPTLADLYTEDILSDHLTEEGDQIGLDHVDKSKGNYWRNEGGVFIK